MKTNDQVLEVLCSKTQSMEMLIKAFDLSVEKSGTYKNGNLEKAKQVSSLYSKGFRAKNPQ